MRAKPTYAGYLGAVIVAMREVALPLLLTPILPLPLTLPYP